MMMMIGICLETQIILYFWECVNDKNEKRGYKIRCRIKTYNLDMTEVRV